MTFQTTVLQLAVAAERPAFGPDPCEAPPRLPTSADRDPQISALETLWESSGDPYLEHHPGWAKLNAQSGGFSLHVLAASRTAGAVDSYAVVEDGPAALSWLLGELSILRRPIERLRIVGGQTFAPDLGPDERRECARGLLDWLAREARGRPIVLQSLPVDSTIRELVRSGQHPFWVLPHGPRQAHFCLEFPRSVAAFYEGLGYKSRKSIRYSIRKLDRESKDEVALKSFSSPDEVCAFLDHAMAISAKTYQYKLLNQGVRDRSMMNTEFTKMSERGWWQGYILYCKNSPVAFIYGYRVGSTFYYWDVGYDPKWREWSVGTVTAVKLIEALITADDPPLRLDFLYGNYDYKNRLSNHRWEEESFYLFPRSFRTFFVFRSLQLTNMLSNRAGQMLERYKLKSRLKSFFRRRALSA